MSDMIGYAESGLAHPMFVRRNNAGQYWNTSGTPAFENWTTGNLALYSIAATETGVTGTYTATDPAATTAGQYLLIAAAGASLTVADVANNKRWQGDVSGSVPQTGDSFIRLGTPAGASIAADLAEIEDGIDANALILTNITDPLTNPVPGSYAPGTAGAMLGRIGSSQVTTSLPVATNGVLTLIRGDDYFNANSRALPFNGPFIVADLTSATILFVTGNGLISAAA